MKVCVNCQRVNLDEEPVCVGCGGEDFKHILNKDFLLTEEEIEESGSGE